MTRRTHKFSRYTQKQSSIIMRSLEDPMVPTKLNLATPFFITGQTSWTQRCQRIQFSRRLRECRDVFVE